MFDVQASLFQDEPAVDPAYRGLVPGTSSTTGRGSTTAPVGWPVTTRLFAELERDRALAAPAAHHVGPHGGRAPAHRCGLRRPLDLLPDVLQRGAGASSAERYGVEIDSCLVNLYRDGEDAWPGMVTRSASGCPNRGGDGPLGARRRFLLRPAAAADRCWR